VRHAFRYGDNVFLMANIEIFYGEYRITIWRKSNLLWRISLRHMAKVYFAMGKIVWVVEKV
jgi:hypothetical protein